MKKIRNMIILCMCVAFCVYLCTDFELVAKSVKNALNIGINVLLPSLFPFFVISDLMVGILSSSKGMAASLYKKLFKMPKSTFGVFISGIISGYPVGASAAYQLFENKIITKKDAEDLVCFTNNSGPLFIICAVGCAMLGSIRLGLVLYIIHIISAIIVGLIIGRTRKVEEPSNTSYENKTKFELSYAIEKGFLQSIKVIGFVVFFAIIVDMLTVLGQMLYITNNAFITSLFLSFIEMTNGISAAVKNMDTESAMCIISFACSFSGLSVYFQTALVTKGKLCLKKYVIYKLFGGIIAMCLCRCYTMLSKTDFSTISYYRIDIVWMIFAGICYILFTYYLFKKHS